MMKKKSLNNLFAATAVTVVVANASITAEAEELVEENAIISEKEDEVQVGGGETQEEDSDEKQSPDQNEATLPEDNQTEAGSDNKVPSELPDTDKAEEKEDTSEPKEDETQQGGPLNFQEAQDNLNKAKEEEAQAKSELDKAQSETDAAQNDVEEAKQEADEAETELKQAQANKEEAETQKEAADKEAARTEQQVEEAKQALDEALQGKDDITIDDLEEAQQKLDDTKEQQETAQQAVNVSQADYDNKKAAAEKTLTAVIEAGKEVTNAEKDKNTADQAVVSAEKEVTDAQKAYDDALEEAGGVDFTEEEENLNKAQEALTKAKEKIASGSLGFFQSMAASESSESAKMAVTILTSKDISKVSGINGEDVVSWEKFISYTHLGETNDATSLENMLNVFDFIEECNELRKKDNNFSGRVDLYVNDALMAIAQLNANWAVKNIAHSQVFNVGENLSWGYPDPFDGWYTEEKAIYDGGNKTWNSANGHYLNIMGATPGNESAPGAYYTTGYAINTVQGGMYSNAHSQEFSGTYNINDFGYGQSYTVLEYKARFMAYYNAVQKELSDAQAAYDAAKAAYDQAGGAGNQAELNNKKTELNRAKAKLEAAKADAAEKLEILNNAKEAQSACEKANDAAKAALAQSKGNLESAQQNLKEKTEAYEAMLQEMEEKFGPEVVTAADALTKFQSAHKQALSAKTKAILELSEAEAALTNALAKKTAADQNLLTKADVLMRKQEALQNAKNVYYEALANLAIAQADYDRLKPAAPSIDYSHVAEETSAYEETVNVYSIAGNSGHVTVNYFPAKNNGTAVFPKGCSFTYFLENTLSFIRKCPYDNVTIDCSDLQWFCFNKRFLENLRMSLNKSLTIVCSYKGRKYTFTIPAGYDFSLLRDSNGWYGLMYLNMMFNGHEIV